MKKMFIILTTLLLVACGGDTLEGDYVPKQMANNPFAALTMVKLSFRENGKVRFIRIGNNITIHKYEKDGNEITLHMDNGSTQLLTIEENGNIIGMGQEFINILKFPNGPFLGTWLSDTKMTIQKNKDLPSELLSELKSGKDKVQLDISEDTVILTEDKQLEKTQPKGLTFKYEFSGSKVNIETSGEILAGYYDFTYEPDPAKLTLKAHETRILSEYGGHPLLAGFTLLRKGEYIILRMRLIDGKIFNSYFIKKEN